MAAMKSLFFKSEVFLGDQVSKTSSKGATKSLCQNVYQANQPKYKH